MKFLPLALLVVALAAGATPTPDEKSDFENNEARDLEHIDARDLDHNIEARDVENIEAREADKSDFEHLDARDLELDKRRNIRIKTTTFLRCRKYPNTRPGSTAYRQFDPNTWHTATCAIRGQYVNGYYTWLRIVNDPPCYVASAYTNYWHPSVPFPGSC